MGMYNLDLNGIFYRHLDFFQTIAYNKHYVCEPDILLGLVLVSTGVLKLGKPSAVRDRVTIRILKLNANENLAYAA